MQEAQESYELKIGKRAFLTTALITLSLMIVSGILTRIIPSGTYQRQAVGGVVTILPDSFRLVEKVPLPVYRWFTAPVEVLYGENAPIVIVLVLLITFIGGSYAILNRVGVFREIISKIAARFWNRRYVLIGAVSLVFMFFGSFLGLFEEIVPLVPVVVILSYTMGWDALLGLGMSLMSACFGFAVAVSNPYSVGVAQKLAGLPVFSGLPFRLAIFAVLYALLCTFLVLYARRLDADPRRSPIYEEDREMRARYAGAGPGEQPNEQPGKGEQPGERPNERLDKALPDKTPPAKAESPDAPAAPPLPGEAEPARRAARWFLGCVAAILAVIVIASLVEGFSDYSMPAIALIYLVAGLGAGSLGGLSGKEVLSTFGKGVAGIAPGILLILMAMSVNHIITRGGILDTIIFRISGLISQEMPVVSALIIYGLVLALNFFIGSASTKAVLLIPIITPLADLVGLTRQAMVLAFCFGDGFSNVLYPTNPVLLISLGLTTASYLHWFKWAAKLQLLVLLLTALFLALAVFIGYGPF